MNTTHKQILLYNNARYIDQIINDNNKFSIRNNAKQTTPARLLCPSYGPSAVELTTVMSKLLSSFSGEISRTSAILALDDRKLAHSTSPIEWISTPSSASWTAVPSETGTDPESLKQALSTSSVTEHDSDLSSQICFGLLWNLIFMKWNAFTQALSKMKTGTSEPAW